MQQHPLNELYAKYAGKILERGKFEGLIYQYLEKNQSATSLSHWERDEYEDYLSWFYPRLHHSIDSYRETGASFDAFIGSIMRMASREYRVRTIIKSVTEYSAWSIQCPEQYAHEEEAPYSYDKKGKETAMEQFFPSQGKHRKNPKQLLALILKCYYYVSEDFIDRIAGFLSIDKKELKKMLEKMRLLRQKRDDELYYMRERIYCLYYRCIVYEKRLQYIEKDTISYLKLNRRLVKARKRLEKMRERIQNIRTDATNKEVAQVIGISKGAVDSNLHKLKSRWDILADKAMLN